MGNKIENAMNKMISDNKSKINKIKKCINQKCINQKCKRFTQKKAKVNCVKKYCKNETDMLVNNVSKKDIKKLNKLFRKPK